MNWPQFWTARDVMTKPWPRCSKLKRWPVRIAPHRRPREGRARLGGRIIHPAHPGKIAGVAGLPASTPTRPPAGLAVRPCPLRHHPAGTGAGFAPGHRFGRGNSDFSRRCPSCPSCAVFRNTPRCRHARTAQVGVLKQCRQNYFRGVELFLGHPMAGRHVG